MQRTGAMEAAANVPTKIFPAVLLLCLAVSGCGSTCVSGFWNDPHRRTHHQAYRQEHCQVMSGTFF